MAKIKNKRLPRNEQLENTDKKNKTPREKKYFFKNACNSLGKWFFSIPLDLRIFFIVMLVVIIISITLVAMLTNGIVQSGLIVGLLLVTIITSIVFTVLRKRSKHVVITVIAMFCIVLTLVSFGMELYVAFGIEENIELNAKISDIKKNSDKIISTDFADIYLSLDEMKVYSVSNFNGTKYVNENTFFPSDESEYYDLYNLGIQMYCPVPEITRLFIYPPTPSTITGYEYLLEIEYKNQSYVTKAFIPGLINLDRYMDDTLFGIAYVNSDNFYVVSKLNDYLIFQSDLSSWSSPYENVTYTSEKEYFYVRYNRYLRQYWGDDFDEADEIGEENIKFAKSFQVVGPMIQKVNIFWLGHVENETFIATAPVIEIIYRDNTSDIAILKDINLSNIDGIVEY